MRQQDLLRPPLPDAPQLEREIHQANLIARREAAKRRRESRRWWCKTLVVVAVAAVVLWLLFWILSGQALPAI